VSRRALLLALIACSRPTIESCDQDLHGVWILPGGERWMVLDDKRQALEAYPLFRDPGESLTRGDPPDVVVAPRVIDLVRGAPCRDTRPCPGASGEVKRRYMRHADQCLSSAPIHLLACKNDELELLVSDPPPPATFAPCSYVQTPPPRLERWKRSSELSR
jgi:hypothetical protein